MHLALRPRTVLSVGIFWLLVQSSSSRRVRFPYRIRRILYYLPCGLFLIHHADIVSFLSSGAALKALL